MQALLDVLYAFRIDGTHFPSMQCYYASLDVHSLPSWHSIHATSYSEPAPKQLEHTIPRHTQKETHSQEAVEYYSQEFMLADMVGHK